MTGGGAGDRAPRRAARRPRRRRLRRPVPVPRQLPAAHPRRPVPRHRRRVRARVVAVARRSSPFVNDGWLWAALALTVVGGRSRSRRAGGCTSTRREALVAAQQAVGFPVGHASAQQVWRGLRSRPTWRVLCYSIEDPPRQRGLVLVDAIDGTVVEHLVEANPRALVGATPLSRAPSSATSSGGAGLGDAAQRRRRRRWRCWRSSSSVASSQSSRRAARRSRRRRRRRPAPTPTTRGGGGDVTVELGEQAADRRALGRVERLARRRASERKATARSAGVDLLIARHPAKPEQLA